MSAASPLVLLRGDVVRSCGFTEINRRLVPGLRGRGFRVAVAPLDASESPFDEEPLPEGLPDVYLFHGDPYDLACAPGRLNACFLHWEYRRLPPAWVEALNARFDLVVAPSEPSRAVYRHSGVRVPMTLFPAAVDPAAFGPDVPPWSPPTRKGFRFAHLGGAHARRGTDVLLRAYAAAFTADDDVALLLKPFHYAHHREWLEQALAPLRRPGAPEVQLVDERFDAVASFFRAADVGVYPLRAECFGLPVLECIASGRRVIVTAGTGLDQFCTEQNARFVAGHAFDAGEHGELAALEPDEDALAKALREAYRAGPASHEEQARVAASVAGFTWERSVAGLAEAFRETIAAQRGRRRAPRPAGPEASRELPPLAEHPGHCLERFRDAEGTAWRLLVGSGTPFEDERALEQVERARCEAPALPARAFEHWRHVQERRLADAILVHDQAGRDAFLRVGAKPEQLLLRTPVPEELAPLPRAEEPGDVRARLLFVSERPFRDGLRPLLEAWTALRAPDCALLCAIPRAALAAKRVVRWLVADPSIERVDPPEGPEALDALLARADAVVHPALLGASAPAVLRALARGRPAIATRAVPGSSWIAERGAGAVLEAAEPVALARAMGELLSRIAPPRAAGDGS